MDAKTAIETICHAIGHGPTKTAERAADWLARYLEHGGDADPGLVDHLEIIYGQQCEPGALRRLAYRWSWC